MFGKKQKADPRESISIENNCIVTIDYRIEDEHGKLLDSTENKGPLSYIHGSDQIPYAFQAQLQGRQINDQVSVNLAADEAYGPYDEAKVQELEKPLIESNDSIEAGSIFETITREGRRCIRILEVSENTVVADLNHFLAGKALQFSATVLNITNGKSESPIPDPNSPFAE